MTAVLTEEQLALRAAIFAALAPRNGTEAGALIEALDAFAERGDQVTCDLDVQASVATIRRRVTSAFGRYFEASEVKKLLAGPPMLSDYSHPSCPWKRCPHPDTCREMDSGCANYSSFDPPAPKGAA